MLNIKQTAHSLIVEQCDNRVVHPTRPWPLPKEFENYFEEHLEGLNLGETGFTYAQDYFTTHIPFVKEVRGYLPTEVKKFFSGGQTQQPAKRSTQIFRKVKLNFVQQKVQKQHQLQPQVLRKWFKVVCASLRVLVFWSTNSHMHRKKLLRKNRSTVILTQMWRW